MILYVDDQNDFDTIFNGEIIKYAKGLRNDLFVTTKLATEAMTYKEAVEAIDSSLKTMNLITIKKVLDLEPSLSVRLVLTKRY